MEQKYTAVCPGPYIYSKSSQIIPRLFYPFKEDFPGNPGYYKVTVSYKTSCSLPNETALGVLTLSSELSNPCRLRTGKQQPTFQKDVFGHMQSATIDTNRFYPRTYFRQTMQGSGLFQRVSHQSVSHYLYIAEAHG